MSTSSMQRILGKKGVEKIAMITCYDYSFARILDGKVDLILVGDSLGNVVLGYDRTAHVTMEDIVRHMGAVRRGAPNTLIIGDLPAGSYATPETAIENGKRIIDAGADAVKPEGRPDIIEKLTAAGIAVMGHLGYLPQTAEQFGVIGRDEQEAAALLEQARQVQAAGAFGLVLECIPATLAQKITGALSIPTIGIGSGAACDGQVLVLYDMLGLFTDFKPRFVRRYLNMAELVGDAVGHYVNDIKTGDFPSHKEEYQ